MNAFIERVYKSIKGEKPWVKFGISPFGIWRPGYPPQIKGFDQYDKLYADARKWLQNGWCDYFAPQLYWAIDPPDQSYPVLLKWWTDQNKKGRLVVPGMNTSLPFRCCRHQAVHDHEPDSQGDLQPRGFRGRQARGCPTGHGEVGREVALRRY